MVQKNSPQGFDCAVLRVLTSECQQKKSGSVKIEWERNGSIPFQSKLDFSPKIIHKYSYKGYHRV